MYDKDFYTLMDNILNLNLFCTDMFNYNDFYTLKYDDDFYLDVGH